MFLQFRTCVRLVFAVLCKDLMEKKQVIGFLGLGLSLDIIVNVLLEFC